MKTYAAVAAITFASLLLSTTRGERARCLMYLSLSATFKHRPCRVACGNLLAPASRSA